MSKNWPASIVDKHKALDIKNPSVHHNKKQGDYHLDLSFDFPDRFVGALTRHCIDPGSLCKIPLAVI